MHQFSWPDCVNNLRPSWSEAIGQERGLGPITFERLRDRSWVGCCYVQKWQKDCLAFPVCGLDGTVFRAHCRSPQRNGTGKWEWTYEPFPDPRPIYPLIFGNLENASRVYLFESQWDGIALYDKLSLWEEVDAGEVCIIATRGAQYAGHLKLLSWPKKVSIYAFPQTDKAGQDWVDAVLAAIGGCYIVEIPRELSGVKDLNEWTRDVGASAYDIDVAIEHAELREPQVGSEEPKPEETEEAKRAAAFSACTSQGAELLAISIPPRAIIISDWHREGDLGFVFAYRGSGKSWFVVALCIALTEGTPFGPWPVSGQWPILYIDGEMNYEDDKERIVGLNGTIPAKLFVLNHEVLFQQAGVVMNLASRVDQKIITELCIEKGLKGIVFDNLGCLFSGVGENEADEWDKVLPWLLDLRRQRISVVMVHHSGHDASRMRGTIKREDSAAWVLRLDDQRQDHSEAGARFISRFLKYRGKKIALDYEWTFEPAQNGEVLVSFKEASRADLILQWVSNGLTRCEDIAREIGVSKGTVSKLATKLIQAGKLKKGPKGQGYEIP